MNKWWRGYRLQGQQQQHTTYTHTHTHTHTHQRCCDSYTSEFNTIIETSKKINNVHSNRHQQLPGSLSKGTSPLLAVHCSVRCIERVARLFSKRWVVVCVCVYVCVCVCVCVCAVVVCMQKRLTPRKCFAASMALLSRSAASARVALVPASRRRFMLSKLAWAA